MLSCADYVLTIGLYSVDATGTKAADSADCMCEAFQVGLRAMELVAGIALKVRANIELAQCDKALAGLSFDSDTKAKLRTLPLGHEELFGGKLDEASKQAEERGHRQCDLKVSFKVPQVQTQTASASAPTYTFQASGQRSSRSGRSPGKGKSKRGKGCGHGSALSGIAATFENPWAHTQGQSNKKKKNGSGRGGRERGHGASQP